MTDKKFLKGLFVKAPHANAPDFVLAKMSIKREDLIEELQSMADEWINLDIKRGKDGGVYSSIDNWKPSKTGNAPSKTPKTQPEASEGDSGGIEYPENTIDPNDIPF